MRIRVLLNVVVGVYISALPARALTATYSQVRPQLQRCDECHDAHEVDVVPFAKSMPFESAAKHATWVADMLARMNRLPNEKGAMPKRPETWSSADIALVKAWLEEGAPNDQGIPTAAVTNR